MLSVKVGKKRALVFFSQQDFVTARDLMVAFGYTRGGADTTLHWLRIEGLIAQDTKGVWTITDAGQRRILYWKSKGLLPALDSTR